MTSRNRTHWCASTAIEADVSKESDCIKLIEETVSKYGRLDVLVNNAGVQEDIPLTDTTLEEWYKIIGIDLTGPFVCSREVCQTNAKARESTRGLHNKYLLSSSTNT